MVIASLMLDAAVATCRSFPLLFSSMIVSPGLTYSTGIFLAGFVFPEPKMVSLMRLANPPHPHCMLVVLPPVAALVYWRAIMFIVALAVPGRVVFAPHVIP